MREYADQNNSEYSHFLRNVYGGAFCKNSFVIDIWQRVGNKAKGWISKREFQQNKVRQIFLKTNIFYPLIRTPK